VLWELGNFYPRIDKREMHIKIVTILLYLSIDQTHSCIPVDRFHATLCDSVDGRQYFHLKFVQNR